MLQIPVTTASGTCALHTGSSGFWLGGAFTAGHIGCRLNKKLQDTTNYPELFTEVLFVGALIVRHDLLESWCWQAAGFSGTAKRHRRPANRRPRWLFLRRLFNPRTGIGQGVVEKDDWAKGTEARAAEGHWSCSRAMGFLRKMRWRRRPASRPPRPLCLRCRVDPRRGIDQRVVKRRKLGVGAKGRMAWPPEMEAATSPCRHTPWIGMNQGTRGIPIRDGLARENVKWSRMCLVTCITTWTRVVKTADVGT
ncbi:uncharacterized protein LOC124678941 [Lolium rigidum]|uniref:uncharacterized protein LOC124678941 n=1 Tax=Lolium rigidum TaxID=89674 RepID=UPI001F5DADAA|nr:uncharacterized protein LOC124678941 [Lolium rigidum]